jgi:ditrans,polycis-polyprenyl diphosphate synthase
MSLITKITTFVKTQIINILLFIMSYAEIPQKVALIMDGNRRYAKKHKIQQIKGHDSGLDTLKSFLQWGKRLGIKEVTAWAWSIDNFNRAKEEIDDIWKLAREKFSILYKDQEFFQREGVKVNIIGNLNLLEKDLAEMLIESTKKTKDNTSYFTLYYIFVV